MHVHDVIQEKFEDLSYEFVHPISTRDIDTWAMKWAQDLAHNLHQPSNANVYGRGSWGFTVLRTVYSTESDALFAQAMENLQRWVSQFYIHLNRCSLWGEKGAAKFKANGAINKELGRRFRIEVIEDAERLHFPDLAAITTRDAQAVSAVFDEWVTSVGEDPQAAIARCARLHDFIAVDASSLASLLELPSTTPTSIRPFATQAEKWELSAEVSFVWFFDGRRTRTLSHAADVSEAARHGAWMKLETSYIPDIWFNRLNGLDKDRVMETIERVPKDGDKHTPFSTGYWWRGT